MCSAAHVRTHDDQVNPSEPEYRVAKAYLPEQSGETNREASRWHMSLVYRAQTVAPGRPDGIQGTRNIGSSFNKTGEMGGLSMIFHKVRD